MRNQGTYFIQDNGTKIWHAASTTFFIKHREGGPAVEYFNGSTEWWIEGKRHREDGPAVEILSTGRKEWWLNGELHRENGPAIEYSNGYCEWWLNGKKIECQSHEEFDRIMKLKAFW